MSAPAPSVRQLRDRNAIAAPKTALLKPSKTSTPISDKTSNSAIKKSASGKENPRPSSRPRAVVVQKPTVRPVPHVDKAAAVGSIGCGEARGRWSRSSVPRGRSSSPSEFIRGFSNLKKDKDSRISRDRNESNREIMSAGGRYLNSKVSEEIVNGSRVFRDFKENRGIGSNLDISGICRESDLKVELSEGMANDSMTQGANFSSISVKSSVIKDYVGLDFKFKERNGFEVDNGVHKIPLSVLKPGDRVGKAGYGVSHCSKIMGDGCSSDMKDFENLKEKGIKEETSVGSVGIKYQSKLHEKLAFLEGKVKRIASDINKTKEMLDKNKTDVSKEILSDIQVKISGIEKVMGHVEGDSDGKVGGLQSGEKGDGGNKVIHKYKGEDGVKNSVKGLNSEELEARLIPHQKLLRNRTSMKASSGISQNHKPLKVVESSSELKRDEKSLSPIDENPVALEFLASLNEGQGKMTARDGLSGLEYSEVKATDGAATSGKENYSSIAIAKRDLDLILTSDETLDDFDDQENKREIITGEDTGDACSYQLNETGHKISTGGWFMSDGESVLLAHDDGSCSFYDIANCEEKTVYKPPVGVSPNIWRDCWIIRAPGADGCSGRYVVAASAGNSMDSGYCSWDFYDKGVRAFHIEDGGTTNSRTILGPLNNNPTHRRNALCSISLPETRQWWYKPCGPLIIYTATSQKVVKVYDVRDGEQIMKWEVQKPVSTMEYSSPLQWRNRGKVVLAEAEAISVWDVNSLNPQALLSVSLSSRKVSALHVNNTDAEIGGGVRQRVSSAEAEGNDGVFCTPDSVNILDFRNPSGIGVKIPKIGVSAQSVFSRGDSIFLGCTNLKSSGKNAQCSQVQQFSLRQQRLCSTYSLPDSGAHVNHSAITQVWGNSNLVMGVCGLGLFVFDALKDDVLQSMTVHYGNTQNASEIIGPDDLYSPSFDYLSSRVLLVSRDRPAMWRQLG
ncbi:hypothetical protein HS088_TW13G01455 [Tripterygium wilfordii]|uniref:At4g14310 8-bladed propeller domain-containing protein n=1 Tax=Tripterygium wilfordii TaxID=458696 RepID=A0A7J7CWR8_TRIWF|nr:KIN14B-interacting protein At4g14310-like [Tripterygium wilfordii]KAF5738555.1 hypothetical protein HS088_TW13G01455 [Tripterygium wilfordii]